MILPPPNEFEIFSETLIIGAGACGMVAALAAEQSGQGVLVLERDEAPSGSTALSAGLIPASGTRWQKELEISDSVDLFIDDIQAKASKQNDNEVVSSIANASASVLEWLADEHGLNFSLVSDFDYPGHSRRRMHGLPSRSGKELIDALHNACNKKNIDIVCRAHVTGIFASNGIVRGVQITRPNGEIEVIGCHRLILACNGFGGNPQMVAEYMSDISGALYFGHGGNQGDAINWGVSLGADTRHLGAYQGHGNVAHPHGILISWAVISEGGFQVNTDGRRFWNEAQGYSEAARAVLDQKDGIAITIFDERIAKIARQFPDFRQAEALGAVRQANTLDELAAIMGLPSKMLAQTLSDIDKNREFPKDTFGRNFDLSLKLIAPYFAVRVTGALFHTQGGLVIDSVGRVKQKNGENMANLWAGGGAACGISGSGDSGYLSGNGLLTAVTLGRSAGLGNSI